MKPLRLLLFLVAFQSSYNLYGEEIPVISVAINNTETSKDDYVSSKYIKCMISLVNGASLPTDIPVLIRNMNLSKGGQVVFSTSGGKSKGNSDLNLILPRDNSSKTFYIKGRSNFYSITDKDAVLEVLDSRIDYDNAVLARKAFMVTNNSPLANTTAEIEMKINSNSTLDDYITWSPSYCSIRLSNYTNFSSPVNILLRNMSASIGKVYFSDSQLQQNSTATNSTLSLTLPNSGTWVNFFIAGDFNNPSKADKDAVIEVVSETINTVYTREALMIRVRKNANNLTIEEKDRFTNSLITLNNTNNKYITFVNIHTRPGVPEGHNGPGFLAWHRAFVLNLERKLQAVDPAVALPYWKFDVAASAIFSVDFMGAKPLITTDAFADFNLSNPLGFWNMAGVTGIRRTTSFENGAEPSSIRTEISTLALGDTYTLFRSMEGNPHGTAHNLGGSMTGDWIRELQTAVQDPLFFLLHSNVDRLWAKWQWINNLFDPLNINTYSPQGEYPNSGIIHIGHYLNDTLWPWNGLTGTYTGTGTILPGNRPTTAPGGPFPNALSFPLAPVSNPKPFDMINYKNVTAINTINGGLGFCYDDVPFQ